MPRRLLIFAAVFCCQASALSAQTFDATHLTDRTHLDTPWLAHAGDDPSFASPDFDDSKWIVFDPKRSLHDYLKERPDVIWYRLHIKTLPSQSGLTLSEYNMAPAFEIYANGKRVLQCGSVVPYIPYTGQATLLAPLPTPLRSSDSLVLAVRIALSKAQWRDNPTPGLGPVDLAIGWKAALRDHRWLSLIGDNTLEWLGTLLSLSVSLVALALYTAQRSQKEYLWIFLAGLAKLFYFSWGDLIQARNIPEYYFAIWIAPFALASEIFLILMYFAFLRFSMNVRVRICLIATAAIALIGSIVYFFASIPTPLYVASTAPFQFLYFGVIPILLFVHAFRGNREARILLVPALLNSASYYLRYSLYFLSLIPSLSKPLWAVNLQVSGYHSLGPFYYTIYSFGDPLFWLSLAVILVWRSNRVSKEQARLEGEMEAARQVQQVILPEAVDTIRGFQIETVYKPAQQVGGDFFQLLPVTEGGLLLVLGDVAGKGMPAAMLVALLVGAIRTVANFTHDPAMILEELNTRMLGRTTNGFSTCLAAYIDASGTVQLANAGHLSPYLNGQEIETPGALPLGIAPDQHYETLSTKLPPGSRLTFYSDGVVEAQNQQNELFGFERARELSIQTAAEIATAASDFGQEDDITVVIIERILAMEKVA